MADIKLIINGRPYDVGCDDGEERRVQDLGQYLDRQVRDIARATGTRDDNHLLVLASLMITNELRETAARLEQALSDLKNQPATQTIIERVEVPVIERVEVPVEVYVPTPINADNLPTPANDAQLQEMGEMVQQLSQRVVSLASRIKILG